MYGAVKNFHTLWLQTLEIRFTTVEGRSWRLMCARAVFPVKVEGQSPSLTLSTLCVHWKSMASLSLSVLSLTHLVTLLTISCVQFFVTQPF